MIANRVPLEAQVAAVEQDFRTHYGCPPRWIAVAPGRVNLIGEHVDYNDGYVLPMAIGLYTVIAAAPAIKSPLVHSVYSETLRAYSQFPVHCPATSDLPAWAKYLAGVSSLIVQRGHALCSLEMVVHSTVPLGSGLSSSASLEVAAATLFDEVTQAGMTSMERVKLCQRAEHEYAGVPCGIMDQMAVAMGQEEHLLLLDCRDLTTQHIPFCSNAPAVLIINSNVQHELANSEYAKRRSECEHAARILGVESLRDVTSDDLQRCWSNASEVDEPARTALRRARHVVSEIERTVSAAEAIEQQNWELVGQLMFDSHASLRDDYEVSCAELDLIVQLASRLGIGGGVYGARMTGGGFGGCAVVLVDADAATNICDYFDQTYREGAGLEPTLLITRPTQGARIISTHG